MEPQCYVDGTVADWQAEDGDPAGCDLEGTVVYLPDMTRRAFERSCDWLEDREDALLEELARAARRGPGRLAVMDSSAREAAFGRLEEEHGHDYLHRFVSDARMVACRRIGEAAAAARAAGVAVTPAEILQVFPAMSFRSERAVAAWLQEGRAGWKPSVRLVMAASLDGPLGAVEAAAAGFRAALASCGPVARWSQRTRPCSPADRAAPGLRLVAR